MPQLIPELSVLRRLSFFKEKTTRHTDFRVFGWRLFTHLLVTEAFCFKINFGRLLTVSGDFFYLHVVFLLVGFCLFHNLMEGHIAQMNAAAHTTVEQSRRGVCLRRLLKNQNLNLRGKWKKTR
jgi:hypothetical protein